MRIPEYLLTQTCTIKPYLGHTPTGKSFGDTYTAKCRFEHHNSKIMDRDGKEFISNAKIFLLPDEVNFNLKIDSEITVEGNTYTIIQKYNHRGFKESHVECVVL